MSAEKPGCQQCQKPHHICKCGYDGIRAEDHYEYSVTCRYASGTMIARCNGKTASCTSSARSAAESAAQKAFAVFCEVAKINPDCYQRGSVEVARDSLFTVNFTRIP